MGQRTPGETSRCAVGCWGQEMKPSPRGNVLHNGEEYSVEVLGRDLWRDVLWYSQYLFPCHSMPVPGKDFKLPWLNINTLTPFLHSSLCSCPSPFELEAAAARETAECRGEKDVRDEDRSRNPAASPLPRCSPAHRSSSGSKEVISEWI